MTTTILGTFDHRLAQAALNGLVGRPAPCEYVSVRVSFGRRRIYVHGVGDYPRRTFSAAYRWGLPPYARAQAVAREYLADLGIETDYLVPTTVRAGDTSTWVVVGRMMERG